MKRNYKYQRLYWEINCSRGTNETTLGRWECKMYRKSWLLPYTSNLPKSNYWGRTGKIAREVGFEQAEITAETNPTEKQQETPVSTVEKSSEFELKYDWVRVVHSWFPQGSNVHNIITYAYKLWGYDFMAVLECENGTYKLNSVWDSWHAHGLCQINDRFHHDIPSDYETNWVVAVEYCYRKWKAWTVFYWPSRIIKWKKCYNYVKNRFTYIE